MCYKSGEKVYNKLFYIFRKNYTLPIKANKKQPTDSSISKYAL